VGVSGLQPWTPPLHGSSRLTQPSYPVADRCSRERSSRAAHQKYSISEDGAKPPLLLSSASLTPSCCFCQQGVVDALTDLELSSGLLRLTGTGTNPSRIRVHHVGVSDTVSLGWRVDRGSKIIDFRHQAKPKVSRTSRISDSLSHERAKLSRTTSEGRSESAPFRPDLATLYGFLSLESTDWKLGLCSCR